MLGFWVKAIVAMGLVSAMCYGSLHLRKRVKGCFTLSLMLFLFLFWPVLWFVLYFHFPIYYLEPYKGRVVEAGTGKPVRGASVIVEYLEDYKIRWAGGFFRVAQKETTTDKDGEYVIPSDWRLQRGGTPNGRITIYRPGYAFAHDFYDNWLDDLHGVRKGFGKPRGRLWNTGFQVYEVKRLDTPEERRAAMDDVCGWHEDQSIYPHLAKLLYTEKHYLDKIKKDKKRIKYGVRNLY